MEPTPQDTCLANYPILSGSNVELCRKALSQVYGPVFLEPGEDKDAFHFSARGVQLSQLRISSFSYEGSPVLGPVEPVNYHTLQMALSGNFQFDINGQQKIANSVQALMISSGQQVRLQPVGISQSLTLVVNDKDLRDVVSTWLGYSSPPIEFQKQLNMTDPGVVSVLTYLRTVIDDLDRNDNLLQMPAAVASLENMLLTFMLYRLEHNLAGLLNKTSAEAGSDQVRK